MNATATANHKIGADESTAERAERAALRAHNWQQRLTVARRAYATHGTIVAVSRACRCDARTSKKLISEIEAARGDTP